MGLIRRLAVKGYGHELDEFMRFISGFSSEQHAQVLVYSTWLRAILQLEGRLHFLNDEETRLSPELNSFPIMLQNLERSIAFIKKEAKGKGGEEKAFVLSIWVHTLRSILRPELNVQAKRMWESLMTGKAYWDKYIRDHCDEDLRIGINRDSVSNTENLSRAILQTLPPKQLYL